MMSSTCASCSAVRVGISGPACPLGGMEVTPEGGVITEGASSSHPTPRARRRSPMTVMPRKAFMPAPLSRTDKLDAARACGGSSARTPRTLYPHINEPPILHARNVKGQEHAAPAVALICEPPGAPRHRPAGAPVLAVPPGCLQLVPIVL